ncbi:MAG: K(+)-transporting ATPase subunit F [Terriglobia bacterium]
MTGCKSLRDSKRRRCPLDYVISGVTALFLFVYLVYALLHPERF